MDKRWRIIFNDNLVPELSYSETKNLIEKLINGELEDMAEVATGYMDLMNMVYGKLVFGRSLLTVVSDNEVFHPFPGESTPSGKMLNHTHNIYRIWTAGGFK